MRTWWLGLPALAKQVVAAVSGAATSLLFVGAVLNIPSRMSAAEADLATQRSDILDLQSSDRAQVRTQDYLICLSEALAGIGAKTPMECANDRIRAEAR